MSPDLPFQVADRRKRGYFTIDNVFIDEYGSKLGAYGISVYVCLARFANQQSECWPSFETVGKRTSISRRQVIREIAKLTELELIMVKPQFNENGEHKSNLYILLDIVGSDSQSPRGNDSETSPSDRKALRKKQKKNVYTTEEERRKAYIPEEYRDIIKG